MTSNVEQRIAESQITNGLKNLQDIKTIEEFDLDKVVLIQGETPPDIVDTCLKYCKEYLSDNWIKQTVDTIECKRLSGGMTNQLYYVAIREPSLTSTAPQEVVIRIYGSKHFNTNERLTDVIIALMVGDINLGPKIYGVSEWGQILHYHKHRQFRVNEQNDPQLSTTLFKKLAKLHSLDVPIKLDNKWLFEYLDGFYEMAFKEFPINDMIEEYNCQTLKKHDLKAEIEWLKSAIIGAKSPIVFSHIDFRGSNIMVTEPNDEIILCDLEYSGYGFRGFDFGTILVEWGRGFGDYNTLTTFPDNTVTEPLIKAYIEESVQIFGEEFGKNEINSYDHILKEAKVFSLAAFMWLILFCLKNDENGGGLPLNKQVMMVFMNLHYIQALYMFY
ncbi:unnamed protein product [Medioppia subpectinata]|uniref:Choline kinase n=1 Tax=Medioppia subpectinata TaxID=1979941 RepID=A0A7R9KFI1_9ACAR|nr:unnamed protein product [Medioppia subpectinata]CAG2102429.1 unnamed protein product [Medioppia subpectinata]